jgi:hypothetical protein
MSPDEGSLEDAERSEVTKGGKYNNKFKLMIELILTTTFI